MEKIIYIHGYKSSGNSNTVGLIRSSFNSIDVEAPTYDTTDANKALEVLESVVLKNIKQMQQFDTLLLVGSSLGGFFANYLSNKYALPVVLINPSLDPLNSLSKYKDTINIRSFSNYYSQDINGTPKVVLLGKLDDVVPYDTFMDRFKSRYKIFINEKMGHRPEKPEDLIPSIDFMIKTIAL